ncbi:exo-beta-1,3-glucanase [Russula ochroleuca]|jgi:glucan 1,3-beta-glucosidase|uniref:Exo-beta-1,3-glucanase n=1 Tax=Russula ochroleuca TaxID=152965 RepID=A0A9P5MYE5_9AGAM|nr:exo-beta-1,3-glucanase [Russula ochroleuca]
MFSALSLASLLAALPIVSSVPMWDIQAPFSPAFPYGSKPVRGVNLGGWLVLEPWITPSLFDNTGNPAIVDEWTFGLYQDRGAAEATLTQHWNTWITVSDFQEIAAAGLNHVRIPIGYWAFDVAPGEPYINGQQSYLFQAIGWAQTYDLKVIIDLHGAPGSQNGFDNSGQRLSSPQWQLNQTNIDRTNAIIKQLSYQFQHSQVVSIIAVLNEPAGFDGQQILDTTRQYWISSYGNIRYPTGQQANTYLLIHDAFQPLSYWNNFMPRNQYTGVAMDTHIYQMFTDQDVSLSETGHIQSACGNAGTLSNFDNNQLYTIVGEWTPAMTDCAKYLNGRGVGARYDGSISPGAPVYGSCIGQTGSGSTFSSDFKTFLRQMWEAQVITYEQASGWIQWTWKTEQADEWSYFAGLQYGWIPQDPTQHNYPNICG